ncbi:glycosyltransferase domain-containing protein [Pectobacterium aroidearum]|uniref:glycosyltransferase domain-containing protein n=1 Tax=Pectobacterium aroidearum TaxID=1201031 RepID=UPI0015DF9AEC|nr:glycosyltransferase domain-containing protein [Pectobacterium aroidearum]MBA0205337.1 DUF616 domain-containing protein [Pectobacterium aroidearum]
MNVKTVVYTIITGGYDNIEKIGTGINLSNIDFYCISEKPINAPEPWKNIVLPPSSLKYADLNRFYKMQPHLLFPNYDISIYVDGNISIIGDISLLIESFINKESLFSAYNHPVRTNVYEEALACAQIGYGNALKIFRQVNRYKKAGFSGNGMIEANILIRKHNNESIKNAMRDWWDEYSFGIKRDQLSLLYCCWRNSIHIFTLGESDARFVNNFFSYKEHHSRRKNTLIQKVINKIYLLKLTSEFNKLIKNNNE